MQSINQQRYNNYDAYLLRTKELELTVIPQLGALPLRLRHTKLGDIFAVCPDEELEKDSLFKSRILFPFNDRIPDGKYSFAGKEYQLPINEPADGSSIHGLVYDKAFSVLSVKQDDSSLVLTYELKDLSGYPFHLDFTVAYTLTAGSMHVSFSCINRGEDEAPVALGWHPYFVCPEGADAASIMVNADTYVPVGDDLMPRGDFESVEGSDFDFKKTKLIGKEELDIALGPVDKEKVRFSACDRQIDIALDGELFAFWQFFVPPDRKSVAIEPITSPTNAFNIPSLGLQVLEAGKEMKGNVVIDIVEV